MTEAEKTFAEFERSDLCIYVKKRMLNGEDFGDAMRWALNDITELYIKIEQKEIWEYVKDVIHNDITKQIK